MWRRHSIGILLFVFIFGGWAIFYQLTAQLADNSLIQTSRGYFGQSTWGTSQNARNPGEKAIERFEALGGTTPLTDCQNDEKTDLRSFDDRRAIIVDVDGDGKADTITPWMRAVRLSYDQTPKKTPVPREEHWISFDLNTSKGRVLNSFFDHRYGTDEGDYWVYALVPCDVNKDGKTDLVFYSGDDTSDETIVLMNKGRRFSVHSRKLTGPGD